MRLIWIIGFAALALLAACTAGQDVLVSRDDWTGTRRITVPEREIYRDGDAIAVVRPIVVHNSTGRSFAVLTNIRRRDINGPRVERVTSGDVTLRYVGHDRLFSHCIDGCQPAETGAILLSEESFRSAARTGLPLRFWGDRGRYEGVVPAEAFAKVLATFDGDS